MADATLIFSGGGCSIQADGGDHRDCLRADTALLIFEVENPTRLDAYAEELRSREATIIADPADHTGWGIRSFYLRDPDGNLIEVNCLLTP